MISSELADAINKQIQEEFQSETYYLGMAAYLEDEDWDGFAHFMKVQAEEEREHALKFFDFLSEVDKKVQIPAIEAPETNYNSIEDVLSTALEQEEHITSRIHNLLSMARENNDYEAESILQWFVEEQVEEENLMGTILNRVRRAQDDEAALLMLDQELGERDPEADFEP
ncbi:MAG: ferritin [bacterium]